MRFFFDVDDGSRVHEDAYGIDLFSDEEVSDQAIGLVQGIMAEDRSPGHSRTVVVTARAAGRASVYRVSLALCGEWQTRQTSGEGE